MEATYDTQKQPSGERNARISQEGILTNHLAKQKQKEMRNKELNPELPPNLNLSPASVSSRTYRWVMSVSGPTFENIASICTGFEEKIYDWKDK